MKIDLTDTTSSKINKALVQGRRAIGTPAVGMVLTLVIVTDEENAYDALKAANEASREHPSRILVVIKRVSPLAARPHEGPAGRRGAGRRGRGHRRDGRAAAVRRGRQPRPVGGPAAAAAGRAGRGLVAGERARATRRRTRWARWRSAGSRTRTPPSSRCGELAARADAYTPGDTDLSWTRITPWRSMLAAALDQVTLRGRPRSRWRARSSTRAASCSRCGSPTGWTSRWSARVSAGPGSPAVRMETSRRADRAGPAGRLAGRRCPSRASRTARWRSSGARRPS